MDSFTDEVALTAGRWDRRFARVLASVVVGERAVAIVDSNGADGGRTYENLDSYFWDPVRGWLGGASVGGLGESWSDGVAFASGHAPAGTTVTVAFRGATYDVEVRSNGYWLFAVAAQDADEYPRRVS